MHEYCSAWPSLPAQLKSWPKPNTKIGLHTYPTTNFLKGSMHNRSPRFGMLASYRLINYTANLTVSHHPKDGHPLSKIYRKEVYNRLGIWHLDLTHKIKISPSWTLKLSFSLFYPQFDFGCIYFKHRVHVVDFVLIWIRIDIDGCWRLFHLACHVYECRVEMKVLILFLWSSLIYPSL